MIKQCLNSCKSVESKCSKLLVVWTCTWFGNGSGFLVFSEFQSFTGRYLLIGHILPCWIFAGLFSNVDNVFIKMGHTLYTELMYQQSVFGTIWNKVKYDKRQEFTLRYNVQHHLGQSEDWIFCASLVTRLAKIDITRFLVFVGAWKAISGVLLIHSFSIQGHQWLPTKLSVHWHIAKSVLWIIKK